MSKENRPEKNGNCWHCNAELPYPLVSCCSGHECGCMGWPIQYPFCDLECHRRWQEKADEQKKLIRFGTTQDGDDLPF